MQTCTTCLFIYNRFKELFFMCFRLKSGCKGKRFIFNHQMFSKVFFQFLSGGWLYAPKGLIPSRSLSPAKVDIGCRILYKGETLLRLSHQVSYTLFQCRISLDCGCKGRRFQPNCQTYHLIFLTLFLKLVCNTLIYNRTSQVLFENNRTGRKWNIHYYIKSAYTNTRKVLNILTV